MQPLAGSSVNSFLKFTNEDITVGGLTLFEDILLKCILVYFIVTGLHMSPKNVQQAYMSILSQTKFCKTVDFPLLERSIEEIAAFLKRISNTISLLQFIITNVSP